MKLRAKNAVVVCLITAIGIGTSSTGRAAQPLRNNFICASPPLCTGGVQSSSDRDVGKVVLHFTVAEGTPDGSYPWSYLVDGTSGGNYSVVVQNETVTSGQDVVIFVTPSFFWGSQTIGIATVTGSQHVFVPSPTSAGFYPIDGYHDCCCEYGCSGTTTYTQTIEALIGAGLGPDENQTRECDAMTGCTSCGQPMASYSIHLMLASLHIEDTPIANHSPIGPSTHFKVAYNLREANQPNTFPYGNLGSKWTHNWLSYVTDDGPVAAAPNPSVYVRGGGAEVYGGFDSNTQSYGGDRQTLAVLVRTSNSSYERRFPNGAKEVFSQSDGTTSPRRVFLTSVVDATGNAVTLTYDGSFRITAITDSVGQSINLSYELVGDPLRISRVTDPFGRSAAFEYEAGKLIRITDPIGIQSEFGYEKESDFINSMTTPYGTSTFAMGQSGNLMRWLEATDPRGGRERVEYNNAAPNIASAEASAPAGFYNGGLQSRNTFYWDKKAMADAPGDYSKAQLFHWLATPEGKISGIKHSEKKVLENRVWYVYPDQADPAKVGRNALRTKEARLMEDGATQLWQYNYNTLGNLLKETDPAGRVTSYRYGANNIDVLEVYQQNPAGATLDPEGQRADTIATYTYNSLHQPLTETDTAGQVTAYTYNGFGQVLTRKNAKDETTTYVYGDSAPAGYLASITSPSYNGEKSIISLSYDAFRRVQTATNEADQSSIRAEYDELDREIAINYPDNTYEQFEYTDNVTRVMTLDLTASRDRAGGWTYRHYDSNRKMDSITDSLGRTTNYDWCICGSLNRVVDPNGNATSFSRDIQNRVYQKIFPDWTTIDYLFEGQTAPNAAGATSRLKSSTDALMRKVNYLYSIDNNIRHVSYTNISGYPLNPPTSSVEYLYDPIYNRVTMMTDATGGTNYSYYPVTAPSAFGAGKVESIDGPLANDTVTFEYDELGRILNESVDGVTETVAYDSLGRLTTTHNAIGHFDRTYDGVTTRLRSLTAQNGLKTNYEYFGNENDRRLQGLQNLSPGGLNLSKFDCTYNEEGQIESWSRLVDASTSCLWLEYDAAQQLLSARNAFDPTDASQRYDYSYDRAGNRLSDSNHDPRPIPPGGTAVGTFTTYTANALNQLDRRTVEINNGAPKVSILSYDLTGNLTDDGEGRKFEWDAANRLIAVDYPGTTKRSEFIYDGLNRRVKIVEKAGSTVLSTKKFVWVGNRIAQERDANDTLTRRYFAEGEQRFEGGAAGIQNYYYTRDHLGSIREVANGAGTVLTRYDYDPYGKRTKPSGKVDVDFGHTGHYHHVPSGLDLTLYRAYHPALGRWISRDPLEEQAGLNLYQDVQNNPVNRTDPLGLFDFRYYGNWGGPGWTGGQRRPYEDLTPAELAKLAPPIDAQDRCYMRHDVCYSRCRLNNGCTSGNHPSKDEMRHENTCEANCDYHLVSCLHDLPRQNLHSWLGWSVFSWRHTIR